MRRDGSVASEIFGSYMGYVEFDGVRFWDIRQQVNYLPVDISKKEKTTKDGVFPLVLPSDSTYRLDSLTLEAGNVEDG